MRAPNQVSSTVFFFFNYHFGLLFEPWAPSWAYMPTRQEARCYLYLSYRFTKILNRFQILVFSLHADISLDVSSYPPASKSIRRIKLFLTFVSIWILHTCFKTLQIYKQGDFLNDLTPTYKNYKEKWEIQRTYRDRYPSIMKSNFRCKKHITNASSFCLKNISIKEKLQQQVCICMSEFGKHLQWRHTLETSNRTI